MEDNANNQDYNAAAQAEYLKVKINNPLNQNAFFLSGAYTKLYIDMSAVFLLLFLFFIVFFCERSPPTFLHQDTTEPTENTIKTL